MTSKNDAEANDPELAAIWARLQEELAGWERVSEESWAWFLQWEKEAAEGKATRS